MNKLIISEGGQPVFLDDIFLLQQNSDVMFQAIIRLLSMGKEAFLADKVVYYVQSVENDVTKVQVGSGTIFVEGMVLGFDARIFELTEGQEVYVCINKAQTDLRQFEDNQKRACRDTYTAVLSTTFYGAYKYYKLLDLEVFQGFSGEPVKTDWKTLTVDWNNGFTGSLKSKPQNESTVYQINISSVQTSWNEIFSEDSGWLGLFPREQLVATSSLRGRRTPDFIVDGIKYRLEFDNSGFILLKDSYRHMEGNLAPAFLPSIQLTWLDSEMTPIS